jgi:hypothetical protein
MIMRRRAGVEQRQGTDDEPDAKQDKHGKPHEQRMSADALVPTAEVAH